MPLIVRTICLLLLFLLPPLSLWASPHAVSIGVLAKSGEDIAVEKWTATADYLSARLPDYRLPLSLSLRNP